MEMKFLIALCFICSAYSLVVKAAGIGEVLKGFRVSCEKETGVDSQLIEDGKKGTFSEDPKFKSFMVCLAKKFGFINENGEIQHDVLRSKVGEIFGNQKKSDELDAACAVKKATVEDTVMKTLICYKEKSGSPLVFI